LLDHEQECVRITVCTVLFASCYIYVSSSFDAFRSTEKHNIETGFTACIESS
jgi:hypothetical protein